MGSPKASLDIFWLKDESLEDSENLPAPEVLAAEIVASLETALEELRAIYEELSTKTESSFVPDEAKKKQIEAN
jgi:type I restriction enzyme M protein